MKRKLFLNLGVGLYLILGIGYNLFMRDSNRIEYYVLFVVSAIIMYLAGLYLIPRNEGRVYALPKYEEDIIKCVARLGFKPSTLRTSEAHYFRTYYFIKETISIKKENKLLIVSVPVELLDEFDTFVK